MHFFKIHPSLQQDYSSIIGSDQNAKVDVSKVRAEEQMGDVMVV